MTENTTRRGSLRTALKAALNNGAELSRKLDAAETVIRTAREWQKAAIEADRRATRAEITIADQEAEIAYIKRRAIIATTATPLEMAYPGKREIGCIDIAQESYSYDMIAVMHDGAGYWIATDSGCSCPTPFENNSDGDDLITGPLTIEQCREEVVSLARDAGYPNNGSDEKVAALIRTVIAHGLLD